MKIVLFVSINQEMTAERIHFGRKKVLVGIRLDDHAKELLDWAVVKVADSGDSVVAIHVCRNSGTVTLLLLNLFNLCVNWILLF